MRISFTTRELKELGISVVALSIAFYNAFMRQMGPAGFAYALIILGPAFALHELAHKISAMKLGYWSEYRMWPTGLILAIALSFMGVVFAAPGAVYTFSRGFMDRRENGIISASGGATNLLLAILFLAWSSMTINPASHAILEYAARINAFLAFFNLLPIPPLDGMSVFRWSKVVWVSLVVPSILIAF